MSEDSADYTHPKSGPFECYLYHYSMGVTKLCVHIWNLGSRDDMVRLGKGGIYY